MAPVASKFQNRKLVFAASSLASALWFIHIYYKSRVRRKAEESAAVKYVIDEKNKKQKAHVNVEFFVNLGKLLKIIIPGWFSSEAGFMAGTTGLLIVRSLCDIWNIYLGTLIESAIIQGDHRLFGQHLGEFVLTMPLVALVNNMLKFTINELKLKYRKRLTEHLCDQYLQGMTFYRMNNMDNRVANPDHLLTTDVEKFCNSFAHLYSSVSKPVLDIIIYIKGLTTSIGGRTPSMMAMYMLAAGAVLSWIHRPVGKMTMQEQRLEGEFRYVNSRLITHSEEIAFYQGNQREKLTVITAFRKLMNHLESFADFRFYLGYMDNVMAKYLATVCGYYSVSRPFLNSTHRLASVPHKGRLEEYYKSGRMLVKLSEAIGKLILAVWELTRLAGYTARITELMKVLEDINKGGYHCTTVLAKSNGINGEKNGKKNGPKAQKVMVPGAGKVIVRDRVIQFDRVPLVTPNGDVLIEELTFEVRSGVNVLVCGPNGCGKSSLFRLLGELWPLFGGRMVKPSKEQLFYIPQRPYMTLGTFRDQVTYPHGPQEMRANGIKDDGLVKYLDLVQLGYLLEREGGWDAVADWMDVLSGGEKQRIAMARLFYHQPQFAILDECTSAVSVDVEGSMYQYCRQVGITLFTVSHRKSLWKHHEYVLYMDGRGSYEFKPIEEGTEEFGS